MTTVPAAESLSGQLALAALVPVFTIATEPAPVAVTEETVQYDSGPSVVTVTPGASVDDPTGASTLHEFCGRVDEKLSSVHLGECLATALVDSGARSTEQTALLYRDFLPPGDSPDVRVLLIGGIHGDEYSSVSIVFKWLAMLGEDLGHSFHWRVIPVLNPDGLLRPPRESQRMNANGVDLNRNFPTPDWGSEAHEYWVRKTHRNARRYPGPSPLSEPETAWVVEQIELFEPHAVVSVHAPHGVIDFDGPKVPPANLGPLELQLLGTYPGSMGRYVGVHKGIPLLTVELESASAMPSEEEIQDIWFDMIGWLYEKVALPLKLADEQRSLEAKRFGVAGTEHEG